MIMKKIRNKEEELNELMRLRHFFKSESGLFSIGKKNKYKEDRKRMNKLQISVPHYE